MLANPSDWRIIAFVPNLEHLQDPDDVMTEQALRWLKHAVEIVRDDKEITGQTEDHFLTNLKAGCDLIPTDPAKSLRQGLAIRSDVIDNGQEQVDHDGPYSFLSIVAAVNHIEQLRSQQPKD